ncbi:hypothetical protein [Amycolatopsis sp. FDAARGOS 1241]|uniref:hypothetical protein n=1 Tax=Amycolatopsis sp. FDAARGOS 1241 TaxID=2778070 RepID=UPI001950CBED|nr:hypothetical protein [Amycolatopsis sp. FDAARGOS 1241]QRP42743.1 hypothetical protein I6J71_24985 [Amycolatopsis sp. FDAARGOS 1241]
MVLFSHCVPGSNRATPSYGSMIDLAANMPCMCGLKDAHGRTVLASARLSLSTSPRKYP